MATLWSVVIGWSTATAPVLSWALERLAIGMLPELALLPLVLALAQIQVLLSERGLACAP